MNHVPAPDLNIELRMSATISVTISCWEWYRAGDGYPALCNDIRYFSGMARLNMPRYQILENRYLHITSESRHLKLSGGSFSEISIPSGNLSCMDVRRIGARPIIFPDRDSPQTAVSPGLI